MGSWNHTCALSNLHVHHGQEVVVFMLAENKQHKTFCYGNALYDVLPVPFYGKYDDYGGVEECHGFGLNIVVDAIRQKLYKFGQGPNPYHDPEVNADNFTVEKMFEADHEDRLGIEHHSSWDPDAYDIRELTEMKENGGLTDSQQFELNRLSSKLKQEDTFRRVTHIVMRKDVLDQVFENWYIQEYVGEGEGTHGYKNCYSRMYFKDLEATIPEYIRRMKEKYDKDDSDSSWLLRFGRNSLFKWDDDCTAGAWLNHYESGGESSIWGVISVSSRIADYVVAKDWEGLESFAKEVLYVAWVNAFMSYTRKIWTKQTGAGSQNSDYVGYEVLAKAVQHVIAEEKKEYDYEEDDDDDVELEGEDVGLEQAP